jgi:hypothetical protein
MTAASQHRLPSATILLKLSLTHNPQLKKIIRWYAT